MLDKVKQTMDYIDKIKKAGSNMSKKDKKDNKKDKYEQKQSQSADMVIRNHVMWSMGAGFIPVPIADFFAVSAVQLDMVRQLCKLYDIDYKETEGKALITTLTGASLARLGAQAVIKLLPGVGTLIGGATLAVFSGASTYALGEVFKRHFETGGTFLDFDPARLKKYYQEKFEKGKKVAKNLRKEQEKQREKVEEQVMEAEEILVEDLIMETEEEVTATDKTTSTTDKTTSKTDIITRIKELAELKNAGIISEDEFAQLKAKLIGDF